MSVSTMDVAVLVTGEFNETSLLFLDTLNVRETAKYLILDGSQAEYVRRYVQRADILDAQTYVEQDGKRDQQSGGLILIPGHKGIILEDDPVRNRVVRSLNRIASSASLNLDENYIGLAAGWRSEEIIRDISIWTAKDSTTTLRSLAFSYKAVFRMPDQFPPHAFDHYRSPSIPTISIGTPGENVARIIAEQSSSEAKSFISSVALFAVRLGLEGHVSACSTVILSLLALFPNAREHWGPRIAMSLEAIWRKMGERPSVPWEITPEELGIWDEDAREGYHIPPEEEDRLEALEELKVRVSLGQEKWLYPYTTEGAIVMALQAGWIDEAREWMTMFVKTALIQDNGWYYGVGGCQTLVDFALTGIVVEITGHTASQAEQDAATIRQALLNFPKSSAIVDEQKRLTAERFAKASWPVLVRILDICKLDIDETALRPPASPSAILEAEERLGVELPSDYKEFLLISNGMEDLSVESAPRFQRVEELCWQSPEKLGLDWVRVTLGCEVDLAEEEQLPSMKRVLDLTGGGEAAMWYVEPDTVEEAIEALKRLGRSDEAVGRRDWRPVHFLHWAPETKYYRRFRDYIEEVAQEAEKAGAKLVA
ncbi:hypothetical protein EVJ58_g5661 [Rhodofomes roseus]|uniref:Knr4/Smi1-like domain-containing protein n=1 Tax=Rhodofomes roseus TaxID=34475 RepID=A0A4Y9YD48_9APHY|nr:hypothetical protein EVJ58_g5661 [Rhodofomes roseus]